MRISRARGWLAVAAIALQSTEAAFVTFTSGFSDNPDDSIAVIYAQALKVFDWTTDPGVTVSEIKLFSVDGNGKETLISSKQKSGSADLAQTATTSTSGPATTTTTTIGSKNGRSIEDGAAGGRDTRTLVLDCEHHSPLGPGNKTLACVGGGITDNNLTVPSVTSVSIQGFDFPIPGQSVSGQAFYLQAVSSGGINYSRRFGVAQNEPQFSAMSKSGLYISTDPYVPKNATLASGNGQLPNSSTGGMGGEPSTTSGSAGVGSTQAAEKASNGGGLSSGAVIGIAVACGVVGLILVFALVWFLLRRRQQKRDLRPVDSSYASGNRTDELMAEKEAGADVDVAPHSPYSDEGMSAAGPSGTYQDDAAHGGAVAAGAVVVGAAAAHRTPQQDQARSFTPYSDRPSPGGTGAAGTPIVRPESVAQTDEVRVSVPSATPGRATPRALTTPYAHLVEEGMTEEEIRRLEDEERQLDAAIEQAGRR